VIIIGHSKVQQFVPFKRDGTVIKTKVSSDTLEINGNLNLGGFIKVAEDSGVVTLTDMSVSSTPTAGDEMSFTQKINGTNILTVGAEADSLGGIQNQKIVAHCGVNIKEITTPTAKADYGAIYTKTDNKLYFQDGAGSEHEIGETDTNYGEMYWDNNSTITVIETANTPILVNSATTGILNGWTYVAGSTSGNANAISVFADYSGTVAGTVLVTDTGHGLVTGDIISIRGTTNYNGVFQITKVSDNTFYITDTWVANDATGDWDLGSYLLAGSGAVGKYRVTFSVSATVASSDKLTLRICKNVTLCTKCISTREFANNDQGNLVGGAIADISTGDKIYLAIQSDGTSSVTIQYGNFNLTRL